MTKKPRQLSIFAHNTDAKAGRLYRDGKVTITSHEPGRYTATVNGDHGTYHVIWDDYGWHCTCPAGRNNASCSHTAAVNHQIAATRRAIHRSKIASRKTA